MESLFKGIYSKFDNCVALKTLVTSRLYLNEAPQGVAFPYIVYTLLSGTTDWELCPTTVAGVRYGDFNLEDIMVQFDIFSNDARSPLEVSSIYDQLWVCFDWKLLDLTLGTVDYTNLYMRREFYNLTRNIDEKWWQYTVQYRILMNEVT